MFSNGENASLFNSVQLLPLPKGGDRNSPTLALINNIASLH